MPPAHALLNDSLVDPNAYSSRKPNSPGTLNRVIFYTLLAVFPLTAIRYGTVEPWWQGALEATIYALGGISIIYSVLTGGWHVRDFALLTPLVVLAAFAYFQTLAVLPSDGHVYEALNRTISSDAYATWFWLLWILALIILAELLFRYTSSQRRLWLLTHTIIGVGVLSAMFGIIRQMAQRTGDDSDSGFLLAALRPNIGYGQFINQNHFALLMEMALGLLLGLVLGGVIRRLYLPVYLAMAAIIWFGLVLTESRGGIIAMLCEVLFLAFVVIFIRTRKSRHDGRGVRPRFGQRAVMIASQATLAALLVMAIVVGVAWVGGDPLARRFERIPNQLVVQDERGGGDHRIDIWRATWQLIKANAIVGVGFGGYGITIPRYHVASPKFHLQEAHNEYLELLAGGGVVALATLFWFGAVFVRRAGKCLTLSDGFGKAACIGALAGLCAIAVHSLVDFGLHIPINAMSCVALIVIATTNGSREKVPVTTGSYLRRFVPAMIAVSICLGGVWFASRAGLSKWYSAIGNDRNQISSLERATLLAPNDASAYSALGEGLLRVGRFKDARVAFEHAVVLRPDDYLLWGQVGNARNHAGDNTNALMAYQEAVRLAPYYLQPRLNLGYMFFRVGRREEGMVELRRAIESEPGAFADIVDFTWKEYSGNAEAVTTAMQPQSPGARLRLARFFIRQGATLGAIRLFCGVSNASDERNQLLAELLDGKQFVAAHSIWSDKCEQEGDAFSKRVDLVANGGFEKEILLDEQGFGWRLSSSIPTIRFSLDAKRVHEGGAALFIVFSGDSKLSEPFVSQLVLIEPASRYRLTFVAAVEDLITGGPIVVNVSDANAEDRRGIAMTNPLPRGTTEWVTYNIDFQTPAQTRAIWIDLTRQSCGESACPIFGNIRLDDFKLQKL